MHIDHFKDMLHDPLDFSSLSIELEFFSLRQDLDHLLPFRYHVQETFSFLH
jgi:hypothetical protein